jgi:hypothetical protein
VAPASRQDLRTLVAEQRAKVKLPALPDDYLDLLDAMREHLKADATLTHLKKSPYWPKWQAAWWAVLLLTELGESDGIPAPLLKGLVASVDAQYLHGLPRRPQDIGDDVHPERGVLCPCALGSLWTMLAEAEVEFEKHFGWARPALMRVQLPDGGLNCDLKAASRRSNPRSSFASTLPALEAVLKYTRSFTAADDVFLEKGSRYLIKRGLFRSLSKGGAPANPSWLAPAFPRLGGYDVLRGLVFVTQWARDRQQVLEAGWLVEVVQAIAGQLNTSGALLNGAVGWSKTTTWAPSRGNGWSNNLPAKSFDLLDRFKAEGQPSHFLTRDYKKALDNLAHLEKAGLIRETLVL